MGQRCLRYAFGGTPRLTGSSMSKRFRGRKPGNADRPPSCACWRSRFGAACSSQSESPRVVAGLRGLPASQAGSRAGDRTN